MNSNRTNTDRWCSFTSKHMKGLLQQSYPALSSMSPLDINVRPTTAAAILSCVLHTIKAPLVNMGKPMPQCGIATPGRYNGAPFCICKIECSKH